MKENHKAANKLVDHLFRHESGKLIATLTWIFGPAHLQLAEDIVQDTLITAMDHWTHGNVPDNPAAWLTQVAKRKTINTLKRNKALPVDQYYSLTEHADWEKGIAGIFMDDEIRDNELRMIFTCCHPALPLPSQIALTLKALCGFSINETSRALMTNETTINKRLYRAKEQFRSKSISYDIPKGKILKTRLKAVMLTLYLLFNEGYNSSSKNHLIRENLCVEAIRLTGILIDFYPKNWELNALMSLMCLHAARFAARTDQAGGIIIFEEQDRSLWDPELIIAGIKYLNKSTKAGELSEYHLEAGIAAEHCLAKSFNDTDWNSLFHQYGLLYKLKPNPVIQLNMAIIQSQLSGVDTALQLLKKLEEKGMLKGYYLLPVTQGIFHEKSGNYTKAVQYLIFAKKLTVSNTEIEFLDTHIKFCMSKN